jgi:IS30 family transposase
MHKQFTESDRAVLAQLLALQVSKKQIAARLNKDRSSVYRELVRNSGPLGYIAVEAQQRAQVRRRLPRRRAKLSDPHVREYVERGLEQSWSPDQIAGRSQREFPRRTKRQLSRQTIYNWIDDQRPERRKEWRSLLRFGQRRRKRPPNGRLPGAVSIEGRPQVVDARRRFGDWEGDTIVSCGRRGGLVSLVERKSGYTLLARVDDLRAPTVRWAAQQRLAPLPRHLRRTMTFDNGKEFAEHEVLAAATGMGIYFAKPYCAWQRGTNENTNGLVRQYLPKRTDLTAYSHHDVAAIQHSLNDRPRKRLGYLTPREVPSKTPLVTVLHLKVEAALTRSDTPPAVVHLSATHSHPAGQRSAACEACNGAWSQGLRDAYFDPDLRCRLA